MLLISLMLCACESFRSEESRFSLISPETSGIDFVNALQTSDTLNILEYEYIYNGGGVAIADFNRDSLPDIFFTGNMVSSRLYLNEGNLRFRDITKEAGLLTERWCTGAAVADINADGWPDIYVSVSQSSRPAGRRNLCFINRGDLTFEERGQQLGIADTAYSNHAAFLDYDRDGDIDLYVLNATNNDLPRSIIRQKVMDGSASSNDQLYRNDGEAGFTRVTQQAGILHEGFGLGVGVHDFNDDGWPDILVTNDYLSDDLLYINRQDGTFGEASADYFGHISHFAMGNDIADLNHDGLAEVVTLDMLPEDNYRRKMMSGDMNYDKFNFSLDYGYQPQYMRNMLHLARELPGGKRDFAEIGTFAGIHATDWSWSALMEDFDNDGLRDLAITNGYRRDVTDRDFIVYRGNLSSKKEVLEAIDTMRGAHVSNYIFRQDDQLRFTDKSREWGMYRPSYSNGAAFADLDRDGDLDYVVSNIDEPPFLYRNNSRQQDAFHFLRVRLRGPDTNPMGLGAKVFLYHDGQQQYSYFSPYRGFQSSVEPVLHFGLGSRAHIDSLLVRWPDGRISRLSGLSADRVIDVDYAQSLTEKAEHKQEAGPLLFSDARESYGIHHLHEADPYIDFSDHPLLLQEYSNLGPALAVGDVNGDGLEDFFVGGDRGQSGALFIRQQDGTFQKEAFMPEDQAYHDMGSLLFDAEGDGDLDLYVGSGGHQWREEHDQYRDRLYLNDGQGHFFASAGLPDFNMSTGAVKACDYDRDGDLDLLVTARLRPGQYPLPASSKLLRNDSDGDSIRFVEADPETAPALLEAGLVSDALWTDVDNDGWTDLLLAGEWMSVRLLKNQRGKLTEVSRQLGLNDTEGWWNSISAADIDADGDTDYLLGNLGLNTSLKASAEEPLRIFAQDFDQNGEIDPLFFHYIQGKSVPLHSRDAIMDQLYRLKVSYPQYADFASATETTFFSKELRETSYTAEAKILYSAWLENEAGSSFKLHPLPDEFQWFPVFGTQFTDLNEDALPDLLAAGNLYSAETIAGRYDAGAGLLLLSDQEDSRKSLQPGESGFYLPGDVKSLVRLPLNSRELLLLAGANNDSLRVLRHERRQTGRLISPGPDDVFALIKKGDYRMKKEFYYGDSYLGQSSRSFYLPSGYSATIVNVDGERREVNAE